MLSQLITCDHLNYFFCLTETWLKQEDYLSINESAPSSYLLFFQFFEVLGEEECQQCFIQINHLNPGQLLDTEEDDFSGFNEQEDDEYYDQ